VFELWHTKFKRRVIFCIEQLLDLVQIINERGDKMSAQLDALNANVAKLQADVTAMTSVDQSILALITGLNTQVAELTKQLQDAITAGDPTAIQAAADALAAQNTIIEQQTAALAAAVPAATTPAA
jgi:uncharacterized coiled-coil protein SlyX